MHRIHRERYILQKPECWVVSYPTVPKGLELTAEQYDDLWDTHPEEHGKVRVYGKEHDAPRYFATYGKSYTFSKTEHHALPLDNPMLVRMLDWVDRHAHHKFDVPDDVHYNQVLVNWYVDGNHYIGAHSDSEKELVENMPIYSFSYGAERVFRISAKDKEETVGINGEKYLDISMPDGSLLVMGGRMQKHYKHEVPKSKKVTTSRINITMRIFKE